MSEEEEILGAFNLINDVRILSQEEFENVKQAIKTMLDLYSEEKEKNKVLMLENSTKEYWKNSYIQQVKYGNKITLTGEDIPNIIDMLKKDYISKDKIKREIAELEEMSVAGEVFITSVNFAVKILKELLKGK